jgi:hypothetical protein
MKKVILTESVAHRLENAASAYATHLRDQIVLNNRYGDPGNHVVQIRRELRWTLHALHSLRLARKAHKC